VQVRGSSATSDASSSRCVSVSGSETGADLGPCPSPQPLPCGSCGPVFLIGRVVLPSVRRLAVWSSPPRHQAWILSRTASHTWLIQRPGGHDSGPFGRSITPQGPCSSRGDQSGRSVDSVMTTFPTGFFKGAFVASGRAAWLRCSARAHRHQAPGRRAIPSSPAWVGGRLRSRGDSVAASFRGSPPDPAAASCRWPAPRRDQCPAVARVATPARAGRCPLAPGILSPGKDRRQGARLRRGADAMASATP
jgi:hypothetical protein